MAGDGVVGTGSGAVGPGATGSAATLTGSVEGVAALGDSPKRSRELPAPPGGTAVAGSGAAIVDSGGSTRRGIAPVVKS